MMFLLLMVLIALFFIIKNDKNKPDIMRNGPCSRFQKRMDPAQEEHPHKQANEHPVVQVIRMVCNLVYTLFTYWLKFLFFTFLLGLVLLFFCACFRL